MRSTFASLLAVAAFFGAAAAQGALSIATPPPPAQCEPTLLQWTGGIPPYNVKVIDTGDPTTPLEQWIGATNSSASWLVLVPPGTNVEFLITDSTGAPANSAIVPVVAGSNSCLNTNPSSSGPSGPSSSTPAPSGTSKPVSAPASSSPKASSTPPVSLPPTNPTSSAPPVSSPTAPSRPSSASVPGSASGSAPSTSPSTGGALTHKGAPAAAAAAAALGAIFAALL